MNGLKRFRQFIIWIGGWEPYSKWSFYDKKGQYWLTPFPVSILRFFTIFSWGLQINIFGVFFVLTWNSWSCYFSPDGTPNKSVLWLFGKK